MRTTRGMPPTPPSASSVTVTRAPVVTGTRRIRTLVLVVIEVDLFAVLELRVVVELVLPILLDHLGVNLRRRATPGRQPVTGTESPASASVQRPCLGALTATLTMWYCNESAIETLLA